MDITIKVGAYGYPHLGDVEIQRDDQVGTVGDDGRSTLTTLLADAVAQVCGAYGLDRHAVGDLLQAGRRA